MRPGDAGRIQLGKDPRRQRPADGGAGDDHDPLDLFRLQQLRDPSDGADAGDRDRPPPVQAARADIEHGLKAAVIRFFDSAHDGPPFGWIPEWIG